ncbi:MAG: hypothetical protein E6K81_10050 [Candidatus Eisenbacteria bacterium]|uniref:Uncharacterized protein n=1 Tax=Eiseniibacteriota bacterium TaxID=2212470 RepID=A0A538U6H6_UNCEI|nr:MAG: hypothetical protein E6K81_10050 [Candidatus Eisenbacteria bacterium]
MRLPRVVATGFTTAFLGDERTLREFVVGDLVVREMQERGEDAVLYLFNDSLDPLNARQLRVGVNKDPELIRRFQPFCGRPICEVPDPYGCHESYSDHHKHGLVERLDGLGIHPIVVDMQRVYAQGHYAPFVSATFAHYDEIKQGIATECENYTLRNLFRIRCPQCLRIDSTEITGTADDTVAYRCEACGLANRESVGGLRGKLSWKLDCAARWNLYHIDTEVFSKAHLADKGTLNVSSLVSKFFGNHMPSIVRYGDLRIEPRLSGRLLEILPPAMLRRLLSERLHSDLDLTTDSIAHFANTFEVRPGMSYSAYVRSELPRAALQAAVAPGLARADAPSPSSALSDAVLVTHGNRFSEFFYQRRHELRWPDARTLAEADFTTARVARDVIDCALTLRHETIAGRSDIKSRLKSYLADTPAAPAVYPFLRKVFRQSHGASITTLLSVLPTEYLAAILLILSCLTGTIRAQGGADDETIDEQGKAA